MKKKCPWKQLGSRVVYHNPWLTIREDRVIRPDGTRGIYSVVDTKASVYIVALTPRNEVCLVRQYRYPTRTWSWEVPGGNAAGERLLTAAKRELQEETGFTARQWTLVGRFQAYGGVANDWASIFIARDLTETKKHGRDADGIDTVKSVPLKAALGMITRGIITDGQTIAVLTRVTVTLGRTSRFRSFLI